MPEQTLTARRRLEWKIYPENGVGVIVTDLDTEQFAAASHRYERIARHRALRRLDRTPSGGRPGATRRRTMTDIQASPAQYAVGVLLLPVLCARIAVGAVRVALRRGGRRG